MESIAAEGLDTLETSLLPLAETEAIARAQHGEQHAMDLLLRKYRNLVRAKARCFVGPDADIEDLTQIGMIGLWHAIKAFRTDRCVSFSAYASLCVRRYLLSAVRTTARRRRRSDWRTLSLDAGISDDTISSLANSATGAENWDPVEAMLATERFDAICSALRCLLTEFEWKVLVAHHSGRSYREMAVDFHCKVKAVDNALGRIRRKVHTIATSPVDLYEWVASHATAYAAAPDRYAGALPTKPASPRRRCRRRRDQDGLRPAQAAL